MSLMNSEVAIKISSKHFMVDIHNIVGENMEVIKYYIYMVSFLSLCQNTYENQLKKDKIYFGW